MEIKFEKTRMIVQNEYIKNGELSRSRAIPPFKADENPLRQKLAQNFPYNRFFDFKNVFILGYTISLIFRSGATFILFFPSKSLS